MSKKVVYFFPKFYLIPIRNGKKYRNLKFLAIYNNMYNKNIDSYHESHAKDEIWGSHDVPHEIPFTTLA